MRTEHKIRPDPPHLIFAEKLGRRSLRVPRRPSPLRLPGKQPQEPCRDALAVGRILLTRDVSHLALHWPVTFHSSSIAALDHRGHTARPAGPIRRGGAPFRRYVAGRRHCGPRATRSSKTPWLLPSALKSLAFCLRARV